jgi:hypothetical protein
MILSFFLATLTTSMLENKLVVNNLKDDKFSNSSYLRYLVAMQLTYKSMTDVLQCWY